MEHVLRAILPIYRLAAGMSTAPAHALCRITADIPAESRLRRDARHD